MIASSSSLIQTSAGTSSHNSIIRMAEPSTADKSRKKGANPAEAWLDPHLYSNYRVPADLLPLRAPTTSSGSPSVVFETSNRQAEFSRLFTDVVFVEKDASVSVVYSSDNLGATAASSEHGHGVDNENGNDVMVPEPEFLVEDYSCAYKDGLLMVQGRMFLSNCRACFHCDFLGFGEKKIVVRYEDIETVLKKNTAIIFPNAIEIRKKTRDILFFASFLMRDHAFSTLQYLVRHHKAFTDHIIKPTISATVRSHGTNGMAAEEQTASEQGDSSSGNNYSDDAKDSSTFASEPSFAAQRNQFCEPVKMDLATDYTGMRASVSQPRSTLSKVTMSGAASDPEDCATPRLESRMSLNLDSSAANSSPPQEDRRPRISSQRLHSPDSKTALPPISQSCAHFDDDKHLDTQSQPFRWHTTFDVGDLDILSCWHSLLETPAFWVEYLHPPLGYTNNRSGQWKMNDDSSSCCCCWSRSIDFTSPVKSRLGPIAPKSAKIESVQRVRFVPVSEQDTKMAPQSMLLEHTSVSTDVPYGDTFALVNRWEITNLGDGRGVRFRIGTRLKWVKGLPWGASIIQRTVTNGGQEFCKQWKDYVIAYLAQRKEVAGKRAQRRLSRRAHKADRELRHPVPEEMDEANVSLLQEKGLPVQSIDSNVRASAFSHSQATQPRLWSDSVTPERVQTALFVTVALILAYVLLGSLFAALFGRSTLPVSTDPAFARTELAFLRQDVAEIKLHLATLSELAYLATSNIGSDTSTRSPADIDHGRAMREAIEARRSREARDRLQVLERQLAATQSEIELVRLRLKSTASALPPEEECVTGSAAKKDAVYAADSDFLSREDDVGKVPDFVSGA